MFARSRFDLGRACRRARTDAWTPGPDPPSASPGAFDSAPALPPRPPRPCTRSPPPPWSRPTWYTWRVCRLQGFWLKEGLCSDRRDIALSGQRPGLAGARSPRPLHPACSQTSTHTPTHARVQGRPGSCQPRSRSRVRPLRPRGCTTIVHPTQQPSHLAVSFNTSRTLPPLPPNIDTHAPCTVSRPPRPTPPRPAPPRACPSFLACDFASMSAPTMVAQYQPTAGPSRYQAPLPPPPLPTAPLAPIRTDLPLETAGWGPLSPRAPNHAAAAPSLNMAHHQPRPQHVAREQPQLPPEPESPSARNPLTDLMDTEKVYVEQLTFVIRVRRLHPACRSCGIADSRAESRCRMVQARPASLEARCDVQGRRGRLSSEPGIRSCKFASTRLVPAPGKIQADGEQWENQG